MGVRPWPPHRARRTSTPRPQPRSLRRVVPGRARPAHRPRQPRGDFLRSKQTVTVAIDFLNWLTGHGIELRELEQEHVDVWQVTGPSTRLIADRFLSWAMKTRLVCTDLKIQRHRRGTSPRMNAAPQQQLGLPGLLPRPPHRRQSPPQPTSSRRQHTRRAARHTSRTHEAGPRCDPGRGAGLPPKHDRAPCRRLGDRIQQICRNRPGRLIAAATCWQLINGLEGPERDGSLRLMNTAQRMMSPLVGLFVAR